MSADEGHGSRDHATDGALQEETMGKTATIALGTLLVVIGAVFTFQGFGYLGGSAMTGVTLGAIVGPVVALVGLALIARSVRTRPHG
jgi:hypothetical protein